MESNHPEVKFGKTGVLLVNLGTPDSTNWLDIRKYLKEFLSDRRVIEVNPIIWQVILNLFILNFRPSKTAHAYKQIWRKESNESPLLYFTKEQSQKLDNKIGNAKVIVDFAMRYGNPSINSRLKDLKDKGCENIGFHCHTSVNGHLGFPYANTIHLTTLDVQRIFPTRPLKAINGKLLRFLK